MTKIPTIQQIDIHSTQTSIDLLLSPNHR